MDKAPSRTDIGNRLKILRGDLSQEAFSALLGIPLSTYQRYEYGKRLPPLKIISKISNSCDVSADWLIGGSEDKLKRPRPEDLNFTEAVNKLDHLFQHGSFHLVEFFIRILNFASNTAKSGFASDEGDDLMEFLTFITDMSSTALRKAFDARGKITYKYKKNGKEIKVAYRSKARKLNNNST